MIFLEKGWIKINFIEVVNSEDGLGKILCRIQGIVPYILPLAVPADFQWPLKQQRQEPWVISTDKIHVEHNLVDEQTNIVFKQRVLMQVNKG